MAFPPRDSPLRERPFAPRNSPLTPLVVTVTIAMDNLDSRSRKLTSTSDIAALTVSNGIIPSLSLQPENNPDSYQAVLVGVNIIFIFCYCSLLFYVPRVCIVTLSRIHGWINPQVSRIGTPPTPELGVYPALGTVIWHCHSKNGIYKTNWLKQFVNENFHMDEMLRLSNQMWQILSHHHVKLLYSHEM